MTSSDGFLQKVNFNSEGTESRGATNPVNEKEIMMPVHFAMFPKVDYYSKSKCMVSRALIKEDELYRDRCVQSPADCFRKFVTQMIITRNAASLHCDLKWPSRPILSAVAIFARVV